MACVCVRSVDRAGAHLQGVPGAAQRGGRLEKVDDQAEWLEAACPREGSEHKMSSGQGWKFETRRAIQFTSD